MIFDTPEMLVLREKYRAFPNYEVPTIVFLDRFDGLSNERDLLEELVTSVNEQKRRDWLGRLINEDEPQYIGAWFEIVLFGWLRQYFEVQVEPQIQGNYPDFVISVDDYQLAIEARAYLISPDERERQRKIHRFSSSLDSIKRPFIVHMKIQRLGERVDVMAFIEIIEHWLDSASEQEFVYQDALGNEIRFSAEYYPTFPKVGILRSESLWVNPEVLKPALNEKAKQHKALRNAGYPYVIAIFLEPSHLSAEEVVGAWFGRTKAVVGIDNDQVVEESFDQSGIHFFGKEIRHRSVTGTLVFNADYDKANMRNRLQCWYVQNPYAKVTIDPLCFPVESRYVVVEQDDTTYQMRWVK